MLKKHTTTLEALVDKASLRDVLAALAAIARSKARRLREHWQDEWGADAFEACGNVIDGAADSVEHTLHHGVESDR